MAKTTFSDSLEGYEMKSKNPSNKGQAQFLSLL